MKRLFFMIILVLFFHAMDAQAANWYVIPSGGSGSGTSWTAAWNGLNGINWSSVSCGDTIWVAGGSYGTDFTPQKNCTSGSQLYVRRARSDASACTSAAGWSSGYDATVTMTNTSITLNSSNNYITISGRTAASGGDYGWLVNHSSATAGSGIDFPNGSNASYITFEYMELRGANTACSDSYAWSVDARAMDDTAYQGGSSHHTYSHMKILGWESLYVTDTDYHVTEYSDISCIKSNGTPLHPNIFYLANTSNGILRYNKIHNNGASGTGVAFSDGATWNNWLIYGNVFYLNNTNNGVAINIQNGTATGLRIYNNTFYNNGINLYLSGGGTCGSGSETRNNVYYGTGGTITCGTASNNITATSSAFTNVSGNDFHLTSGSNARNAGISLSSIFTTDMDGTTFGGDGIWDTGAYEYNSGTVIKKPTAPTALQIY